VFGGPADGKASERVTEEKVNALRGQLAVEVGAFVPTVDGRRLVVSPGEVRCLVEIEVQYRCTACVELGRRSQSDAEYDLLKVRLVIGDSEGRAHALERALNPWVLARLAAIEPTGPLPDSAVPIALGIHGHSDRRRYLAVVGADSEGRATPFAYFEESLQPEMDLLAHRGAGTDSMCVRIKATSGGVGGAITPEVVFRTELVPWLILHGGLPRSYLPSSVAAVAFQSHRREVPSNPTVQLEE
jgi:hypothetical protein